jgi:hypothetical protein
MDQPENAAVGIYDVHTAAEAAIRRLQESGFGMEKVSVAGTDDPTGNQTIGYYQGSSGMKYWGELKEFWGPLWGLLSGWAFLAVPGIGPVLVAGPLAGWTVATLDNAAVFGGLTALGAGLYSIGISREGVFACESAVRNGKYLVLVHGTAREVSKAKVVLNLATAVGQGTKMPHGARPIQRIDREASRSASNHS